MSALVDLPWCLPVTDLSQISWKQLTGKRCLSNGNRPVIFSLLQWEQGGVRVQQQGKGTAVCTWYCSQVGILRSGVTLSKNCISNNVASFPPYLAMENAFSTLQNTNWNNWSSVDLISSVMSVRPDFTFIQISRSKHRIAHTVQPAHAGMYARGAVCVCIVWNQMNPTGREIPYSTLECRRALAI